MKRSTVLWPPSLPTVADRHYGALLRLLPQCKEFRIAGRLGPSNQGLSPNGTGLEFAPQRLAVSTDIEAGSCFLHANREPPAQ